MKIKKNQLFKILATILFLFSFSICFSQSSTIIGFVKDNKGNPIKNVIINLYSDSLRLDNDSVKLFGKYWLVNGAYSDENGHYLIKPVPSGRFFIVAIKYGYYIPEIKSINLNKNLRFTFDFELTEVKDSLELKKVPYKTYK